MVADEVPAELVRLWRLPSESRLGRRAELDVDQVVQTAVDLADRDGVGGVTLAKVADALGVTKMALYRHVGSKDELFELMTDLAVGPAPQVSADAEQWRAGLRRWALAHRQTYLDHPWLVDLPISRPPRGPHVIDWMDALLRVLRETGLDWSTKSTVLNLVSGFVRQASAQARQLARGRSHTGLDQSQIEAHHGRTLAKLVEPERFPDAAQLFTSPLFEPEQAPQPPADDSSDRDDDFASSLELILDGIAVAIDRATSSDGTPPPDP